MTRQIRKKVKYIMSVSLARLRRRIAPTFWRLFEHMTKPSCGQGTHKKEGEIMLIWYLATQESSVHRRRLRVKMKHKLPRLIVKDKKQTYLALNDDHHVGAFLDKVVKDYHITSIRETVDPNLTHEVLTAPCTTQVAGGNTTLQRHVASCSSCRTLRENLNRAAISASKKADPPPVLRTSPPEPTAPTIEPTGRHTTTTNHIAKLKDMYESAIVIADQADIAMKALESMDKLQEQLDDLKQQADKYKSDLRDLLLTN